MNKETLKLDQLTSLRFFAESMIVISHSRGLFGITHLDFNGQGVSFFFVLSGFILAYVYPSLNEWSKIKQFIRGRIARIWPAYLVSFLLGFWLLHYNLEIQKVAAFLLMIQSWIPMSAYYFSYNAVSWSVATEFFFYLMFPLVILKWNRTWLFKLVFSAIIVIIIIMLSNALELPAYSPKNIQNGLVVSEHGLVYISPLSRIFEFIFGMTIALFWKKRYSIPPPSVAISTTYEIGAILLVMYSVHYMKYIAAWGKTTILSPAIGQWLTHSGSMFSFGLLIYIIAKGNGKISKILTHPSLVLLGEISFSTYLIHQILLNYYRINLHKLIIFSNSISFVIFFGILLCLSYIMWVLVEIPGRRLIIGGKKQIHSTEKMKKSWQIHTATSYNMLIAVSVLIFLLGLIYTQV